MRRSVGSWTRVERGRPRFSVAPAPRKLSPPAQERSSNHADHLESLIGGQRQVVLKTRGVSQEPVGVVHEANKDASSAIRSGVSVPSDVRGELFADLRIEECWPCLLDLDD